jgi:hypothetical protein
MVAIIEKRGPDKSQQLIDTFGKVAGVIGGLQKRAADQKQLGMQQETHAQQTEKHNMSVAEKEKVIRHDQYKGEFALASEQAKQNGEVWLPNMTDWTGEQATAYKDHQVGQVGLALQDEELKRSRMKTKAKQWDVARKEIMKDMQSADAEVQSGLEGGQTDWNNVWTSVESAYEKHHDGSDIVIGKDGKSYSVKYANGEKADFNFSSEAAMYDNFKSQATVLDSPEGYFKVMAKEDSESMMRNAQELSKSGLYMNDDGLHAQVANLENRSGSGKPKKRIHIWKFDETGKTVDMGEIDQSEFEKQGFMTIENRAKSATIKKTQAQEGAAKAAGLASARKTQSKELTLAENLVSSLPEYLQNAGGDPVQALSAAMRHVMAIKSARDLNSAREYAIKMMGTDFSNPEESAEFMKLYNETHSSLPESKTKHNVKATGLPVGSGGDADKAQSETKTITKKNTSPEQVSNIKKRTEELLRQGKTVPQIKQIILDEQNN